MEPKQIHDFKNYFVPPDTSTYLSKNNPILAQIVSI